MFGVFDLHSTFTRIWLYSINPNSIYFYLHCNIKKRPFFDVEVAFGAFKQPPFFLFFAGAPGRPIIYSPSSTLLIKDSFTLKWRRPDETGGDDDITYTVRYRVEKDNKIGPWITYTTKGLEYDFSDLDNKVQYKFEVIANNKGGLSLPGERYIQTNYPGGIFFNLLR